MMKTTLLVVLLIVCVWMTTRAHVCILKQMEDSETGQVLWSLPSKERCFCQRVVAPKIVQLCTELYPMEQDLWFTSDAKPLTHRDNWTPEALDMLLDRNICYANECLSSPCQHDGICHDSLCSYDCTCNDAYVGQSCEIAIWSLWESWTTCSALCENGIQTRRRLCGYGLQTDLCDGETAQQIESKPCQHEAICPFWSMWGDWNICGDPCSTTNPTGDHTRYRTCMNPDNVNAICQGNAAEVTPCTVQTCETELAAQVEDGCFAAASLIRFTNISGGVISTKTLDQVKVGEFVESYDPNQNSATFSEVYFITHEGDGQNSTKLRKLVYMSENEELSIRLHPKHLVYACLKRGKKNMTKKVIMRTEMKLNSWCDQPPALPVTAQRVNVGDILWIRNFTGQFSPEPVIGVGEVWSSVRHPMTFSHYIVVDDVLASVHMYDEGLYRQATAPLRYAYNISPSITKTWMVRKLVELWDIVEKYCL
ncbi:uncharacterized protein [Amphiura filiformis]|uniref:uncharacterized protein n=1 Tax=Amphiura filiformis TaxID=82378 RepID=UPI003B2255AC